MEMMLRHLWFASSACLSCCRLCCFVVDFAALLCTHTHTHHGTGHQGSAAAGSAGGWQPPGPIEQQQTWQQQQPTNLAAAAITTTTTHTPATSDKRRPYISTRPQVDRETCYAAVGARANIEEHMLLEVCAAGLQALCSGGAVVEQLGLAPQVAALQDKLGCNLAQLNPHWLPK